MGHNVGPSLPRDLHHSRIGHKSLLIMALLSLHLHYLFVFVRWYQGISSLYRSVVLLDVKQIAFALDLQKEVSKVDVVRYISLENLLSGTASNNHLHNIRPLFTPNIHFHSYQLPHKHHTFEMVFRSSSLLSWPPLASPWPLLLRPAPRPAPLSSMSLRAHCPTTAVLVALASMTSSARMFPLHTE